MIITVTLNPALDKTAFVDKVILNGLNRLDNIVYDVGGKGINVCKTLVSLKQECLKNKSHKDFEKNINCDNININELF